MKLVTPTSAGQFNKLIIQSAAEHVCLRCLSAQKHTSISISVAFVSYLATKRKFQRIGF